jgi:hypothetical protein
MMQWGCWGRSNEAQPLKCRIAHAQQCAYAKIPIYISQSCPTELTKFHILTLNGLLLNYNISLLIFKCLGSINHEVRKLRFSEMLKCGDQNISMRNLTFELSRDYCSYTNYHSRSLDIPITIFKSTTMLCETDSIHIISFEILPSPLWISIMLCLYLPPKYEITLSCLDNMPEMKNVSNLLCKVVHDYCVTLVMCITFIVISTAVNPQWGCLS